MTPIKIISGGQTGADISGLRAAKRFGLETGGWMPKGWITEAGPKPEYCELYGMQEHSLAGYRARAIENVADSDATICFDAVDSKASDNAFEDAYDRGKGFRCVILERHGGGIRAKLIAYTPRNIAEWIAENNFRVISIAGNRESKAPGIGAWVEEYLSEVFRLMGFQEGGVSK